MVWVNGQQNSGLVKFVSESRFPWIGIRHLANNNGCEGLKTGIKDGSDEMKMNCHLEYPVQTSKTYFLDIPLLQEIICEMTQKVMLHYFPNRNFVNGK